MNTEFTQSLSRTSSSLLSDLKVESLLPLIHEELLQEPVLLQQHEEASAVLSKRKSSSNPHLEIAGQLLPDVVTNLLNLKSDPEINDFPVRFLYAPDPYDIVQFSFPFGFRYDQYPKSDELDKLADRQQAWESLFLLSGHPLVLLDEYRSELARLRNRIIYEQDRRDQELIVFQKLIEDLYQQYNAKGLSREQVEQAGEEIFNRRFPLLLSILSGEAQNGLKRFRSIIERLIIQNEQLDERLVLPGLSPSEQDRHLETIRNIFDITRAGEMARERYIEHLRNRRDELGEARKASIFTDFEVLDRLMQINQKLKAAASDLRCNYIVLYLSSAPRSGELARSLPTGLPAYFGKPFNFFRDVNQLYAQYLFTSTFSQKQLAHPQHEHTTEVLTRIDSIGLLSIALNAGVNRKEFEDLIVEDPRLKAHMERRRDNFEWFSVANNPNSYRQELLEAYDLLKTKQLFGPLQNALDRFRKAVDSNHNYTSQVKETLRHHSIEVTFLRKRVELLGRVAGRLSTRPTGAVVGINHHLPTLFFFSENALTPYQDWIEKTVMIILEPNSTYNTEALRQHTNDLYRFLLTSDPTPDFQPNALIQAEQIISNYERQTLLYLISMLIPKQEKSHTPIFQNNESLLDEYDPDSEYNYLLSDDITALATRIANPTNIITSPESVSLRRVLGNLRYIQVWSLRREGFFEQSIQVANEAQDDADPNDPRFHHGLALAYFSIVDKQRKTAAASGDDKRVWGRIITEAIRHANTALSIYSNANSGTSLAKQKMQSAIINAIIYLYLLHYEITNNINSLKLARQQLDKNSPIFAEDRRSLPECLHTEALLEFYEACESRNVGNEALFRAKLIAAYTNITRCIEQDRLFHPNDQDPDYLQLAADIDLILL